MDDPEDAVPPISARQVRVAPPLSCSVRISVFDVEAVNIADQTIRADIYVEAVIARVADTDDESYSDKLLEALGMDVHSLVVKDVVQYCDPGAVTKV